ncbi:SpdD-like protein [Actinacidiphila soli]|uniref:SpdD-like protein n=1 Tax=Actinacidiphila soli TaxID=2487275 RepID=UPI000FC9F580|nr:SpdD-like protein [Actinacidiphila soli]
MLRPKIPTNPTVTGLVIPTSITTTVEPQHSAPACRCHHTPAAPAPVPAPVSNRPTVQLTPSGLITVVAGGTAVVLVVGTVLVSLLLAVAVTAASVAVCAIVLRSMLNDSHKRR